MGGRKSGEESQDLFKKEWSEKEAALSKSGRKGTCPDKADIDPWQ